MESISETLVECQTDLMEDRNKT
eukprot:UN14400